MRSETVTLLTSDGIRLAADLVHPAGAVRGAAVVCHPHPLYGGDRHNPVVGTLVEALAGAGLAVVRFDFRGAGGSDGRHDDGHAERLDVAAAIDAAIDAAERALVDAAERALGEAAGGGTGEPGGSSRPPLVLAGYSFGAVLALSVADPRVTGWLAVAPPLRPGGSLVGDGPLPAGADPRPKHLLVAAHDQFAPPPAVHDAVAEWVATTVVELPMADHFLAGAHRTIATEATTFATTLL